VPESAIYRLTCNCVPVRGKAAYSIPNRAADNYLLEHEIWSRRLSVDAAYVLTSRACHCVDMATFKNPESLPIEFSVNIDA
jgi:hypothetical protein